MIRTRHLRTRPTVNDGNTVDLLLVPWDTDSEVTDNGRDFYQERFARGGLTVDTDKVLGEVEHGGAVVARATSVEDRPDGLYATAVVSRSRAGLDLLADIDAGIIDAVSVEFEDTTPPVRAGGAITRSAARLVRWAFTAEPQHPGAAILARRSIPDPTEGHTTMEHDLEPTDPDTATTDTDDDPVDVPAAASTVTRSVPRPGNVGGARSSARYRSFGEFVLGAARGECVGDELHRYQRALAASTTADAAALVRTQWLDEIIDLRRWLTPTIQAFAQRPLPAEGLTVSQPIVLDDAKRPQVGKQTNQGDEVASRKTVIDTVSWTVDTYAGGQNMSLQVILRSAPSYLDEVMRLYVQEMERAKNAAAVAALAAPNYATATQKVTIGNYATTPTRFNDDVVDAAVILLNKLGQTPQVVLIGTAMWAQLAKARHSDGTLMYPSLAATNHTGSVSLTDPTTGAVRDLTFRVEPGLAASTAYVGVSEAFRTMWGDVMTLTADTPATLGRDLAVAQFGAVGVADLRGIVQIAA